MSSIPAAAHGIAGIRYPMIRAILGMLYLYCPPDNLSRHSIHDDIRLPLPVQAVRQLVSSRSRAFSRSASSFSGSVPIPCADGDDQVCLGGKVPVQARPSDPAVCGDVGHCHQINPFSEKSRKALSMACCPRVAFSASSFSLFLMFRSPHLVFF